MIDVTMFIEVLKPLVTYDAPNRTHYMGSTILTNHEMDVMLSIYYKEEYNDLKYSDKRKLRNYIFDELRGAD